ncbi:LPXTG cell wall anchor domain-containing protein [Crossiella sp. CA-258035]|uniref:LPXTG cell wall anchor domain-containing protein n=1 Tax=Crossiella sp. CA-258035 TaxID=2981138 RepID=UPI0024BC66D1|nr:LPXTG cell wall anchor domain-containing protein [Crossiella sp. CA-258035]WHT18382.1 LPXTG cell wall anchor domain-containing protein [Crossiella sp. CA-258035]
MRLPSPSRLLALTLLLCLGLAGPAAAQPTATSAGDPRATAHPGNATTCAQAGLPGQLISGQLTLNISGGSHLTVTAVPLGVTVTGIVVKGGDNHNVYLPGALGLLPWPGLHSPLVGQKGNVPDISHWFACGTGQTTTKSTTKATKSSTATTTTGGATTSTTSRGTTTTTLATTPRTTAPTSTPVPVPVAHDDELASTGFDNGWLLGLGAVLLLAGGVALALAKRRPRTGR